MRRFSLVLAVALLLSGCASRPAGPFALMQIPATEDYCAAAQRVVTKTNVSARLVVHTDLDAFIKSKAVIEGPTIHQYAWHDPQGNLVAISCKMKSADHLNIAFGAGTAGPDGYCHDMNEQVYGLLRKQIGRPVVTDVVFDPSERLDTPEQAAMIGPVWLQPFTLTYFDASDALHIATKGFVIEYGDPRYQRFPPSWRGTHYCHLVAPEYLGGLMQGRASAGATVGVIPELRTPPTRRP